MRAVTAAVFAALLLSACGGQLTDYPEVEDYVLANTEVIASVPEEVPAFDTNKPFAAILNAYAELKLSNFTLYDADLIGHTSFARFGMFPSHFPEEYHFVYAFHDINGDGLPELFIGYSRGVYVTIYEIYTLQNGKPISFMQEEGRFAMRLLADVNSNYVIELISGRMSRSTQRFYVLNESGILVALDMIFTNGHTWELSECGRYDLFVAFLRARYVDGEEVDITEEEYIALNKFYGSNGYGIALEENAEARFVNLDWHPVLLA